MSERNVYRIPEDKILLRTADVYQTEAEDDIDSYSDRLLAIVADFKNSGKPEGYNAQSMVGKSKRGEVACRLFARIDPATGIIEAAGFKSRGCLAMTACASAACLLIEGRPIEDALNITLEDIRECVDDVPSGKVNALHFAACAIKALVGDFLISQGADLSELEEACQCDENSISCIMAEHCSYRQSLREMRMDEIEKKREIEINNALAQAVDLIRDETREGRLVSREALTTIAPGCLTFEEFEDGLVDILPKEEVEAESAEKQTSSSEQETRPSRFANRGVGVPKLFKNDADRSTEPNDAIDMKTNDPAPIGTDPAESDIDAPGDNSLSASEASTPSDVLSTFDHVFDYSDKTFDDDDFELVPPEGYDLVQVDGVWGLVKTDKAREKQLRDIDASGIKMLEGAKGKYFYDANHMSDSFSKLAFLAAEDDPMVTFSYCIREESKTYPRPMAETNFFNDPISMTKDDVRDLWSKAQQLPEYTDIKQLSASNGDVYYYSDAHLSEDYARSLAEWASVERLWNV